MLKRFGGYLRLNVVRFFENHERSFRTDIILLPTLVVAIHIIGEKAFSNNEYLQISAVIGFSILAYLTGIIFVTLIGDVVWSRFFNKIHPIKKHCGPYLQVTTLKDRRYSLAELFYCRKRHKFVHRGIAFDDNGEIFAAWDAPYARYDSSGGNLVIQFSGHAAVFQDARDIVELEELTDSVFFFVKFSKSGQFVGAGLDFGGIDGTNSFGIKGFNIAHLLLQFNLPTGSLHEDSMSWSKDHARAVMRFHPLLEPSQGEDADIRV